MRKQKTWEMEVTTSHPVDKSVVQTGDVNFYTSDTECYLQIRVVNQDFVFTKATITMYNQHSQLLIVKDVSQSELLFREKMIEYKLDEDIMRNKGSILAQIEFGSTSNGQVATSNIFTFTILDTLKNTYAKD